tara:strand:- start:1336 stop:1497 length:162 start_codon:yes stop_codon:yes gene_type:complete
MLPEEVGYLCDKVSSPSGVQSTAVKKFPRRIVSGEKLRPSDGAFVPVAFSKSI